MSEQEGEAPPEAASGRARSTIDFPYIALDEAEKIAFGVHAVGFDSCEWNQLAARLNYAPQGGGFRLRMLAAKVFGLVNYERGQVTLEPLGQRIIDPAQARGAQVEAFLTVPLYRQVFERLQGQVLPNAKAIEVLLVQLGVAPKQADKARQSLMRSARHAGFMDIAPDRLTRPPNAPLPPTAAQPAPGAPQEVESLPTTDRAENCRPAAQNPFVQGLLEKLPAPDEQWAMTARVKWLQTAANIFDLIYSDQDEETAEIEVRIRRPADMR